jgi:hypothetical protein
MQSQRAVKIIDLEKDRVARRPRTSQSHRLTIFSHYSRARGNNDEAVRVKTPQKRLCALTIFVRHPRARMSDEVGERESFARLISNAKCGFRCERHLTTKKSRRYDFKMAERARSRRP